MKTFFSLLLVLTFFAACHRKTVASKTNTTATASTTINNVSATTSPVMPGTTVAADGTVITTTVYTKPIIIVDGKGNIISEKNLPPDASKEILNIQSARSFTPAQTKNLAYRFKYIPPRILYVPANLAKTSSRGTYYIYNKKFYYWKKTDGYFYLDENYYN